MRVLIRSLPFVLLLAIGCTAQPESPPPVDSVPPSQIPPPAEFKAPAVPRAMPSPKVYKPFVLSGKLPYPYPTPPLPSPSPDELVGMVLSQGKPVANIPLTVINKLTGRTYRVKTDAHGLYALKHLPKGRYYAHYYNDRDNNKVGYWQTRTVPISRDQGAALPAWDVYLVGMKNTPGEGQSVMFPFTATIQPYPLAITYRFRIHNAGGPGGHPLFISHLIPAKGVTSYTFTGQDNQDNDKMLPPGHYLWGYQWDSGIAGEGGCLFQEFSVP